MTTRALIEKSNQPEFYARTALCKHIKAGRKCHLGKKCSYAHTEDELQMPRCKYGKKCVYAYRADNTKQDQVICVYRHPEIDHNPSYIKKRSTQFKPQPAGEQSLKKRIEDFKVDVQEFPSIGTVVKSKQKEKCITYAQMLITSSTKEEEQEKFEDLFSKNSTSCWADMCEQEKVKKVEKANKVGKGIFNLMPLEPKLKTKEEIIITVKMNEGVVKEFFAFAREHNIACFQVS
jgi:hypothetical protein